jgi:hypothetical protein
MPATHLLTVWNPAYAHDPLDAHLRVLLQWAERARTGQADGDDDVYVWWAKLRSTNRESAGLPHAADILALDAQARAGVETQLYLTDYRSLYVGHIGEVAADDVRVDEGEIDHMPAYYQGRDVDFWFRLFDIRRLVDDDTPTVIQETKRLLNLRYHERPVSLYGGMVELPLLVRHADDLTWFSDRDLLTSGALWAARDADMRADTSRLARDLPDNLLGRDTWHALEPATRNFLTTAEATYRSRREDPSFDFTGPAMQYAKAIETEMNALLFPRLRRVLAGGRLTDREVLVDGRRLDLGVNTTHQTLGVILHLLEHESVVARAISVAFAGEDAGWLRSNVPIEMRFVIEHRNPAAHDAPVTVEQATRLRERVLGIGEEGLLVRIARAKRRAE